MRKKIFVLIGSLTAGGAERISVSLSAYLAAAGNDVTLVTVHSCQRDFYKLSKDVKREELDRGIPARGLLRIMANFQRTLAFRRLVEEHKPEVVIGMMTSCAIISILACLNTQTKIIASERNFPGSKSINIFWSLLRRIFYRFADLHVVQTQGIANWLKVTAPKKVAIIPNAIAWPVPRFEPSVPPTAYVGENTRLLLAVGTKVHQKGFDLLLQAFERCASEYEGWDLAIVGIEAKTLKERLPKNLANRVHLPGRVGNVSDWYDRADIFALSSRYEGFPNVLMEAMGSGCACVAFNCPTGPSDLIIDGENGLLVESENVPALADTLCRAMGDIALREHVGSNATSVRDKYNESFIYGLWVKAIEEFD